MRSYARGAVVDHNVVTDRLVATLRAGRFSAGGGACAPPPAENDTDFVDVLVVSAYVTTMVAVMFGWNMQW